MALDAHDKRYIDDALERNRIRFRDEMQVFFHELTEEHKSHMTALKEGFQGQVKMLAELIEDRPTKNEVREMIRKEISSLNLRVNRLEARIA